MLAVSPGGDTLSVSTGASQACGAVLLAAAGQWDIALVADALGFLGAPKPFAAAAAASALELLRPLGDTLAKEAAAHLTDVGRGS